VQRLHVRPDVLIGVDDLETTAHASPLPRVRSAAPRR
jgi:hypothetical protein